MWVGVTGTTSVVVECTAADVVRGAGAAVGAGAGAGAGAGTEGAIVMVVEAEEAEADTGAEVAGEVEEVVEAGVAFERGTSGAAALESARSCSTLHTAQNTVILFEVRDRLIER
jgi:hypothetical protein